MPARYLVPLVAILFGVLGLAFVHRHFAAQAFNSKTVLEAPAKTDAQLTHAERIRAVIYFCDIQYHKESCVHHMIACGETCVHAVSIRGRARMVADYKELRRSGQQAKGFRDAE